MTRPDTFVTLLTPLAPAGLAAVRLFGLGARDLLGRLLRSGQRVDVQRAGAQRAGPQRAGPQRAGPSSAPAPDGHSSNELHLIRLIDPRTNEPIDDAIIRWLPAQLGAEVTIHGGVRIVQRLLVACQSLGAARLDPGNPADAAMLWQQSRDLASAEGLAHPALWADIEATLPLARTRAVADWIVGQWSDGLARALSELRSTAPNDKRVMELLERLRAEYPARRRAIDGVCVAIVGPANAGKSTLFNALAGTPAAIVSDQPGTTRDYVSRWVSLAGHPADLIDTAGLRAGPGELESRATSLSDPIVRSADLRLVVLDRSAQPGPGEVEAAGRLLSAGPGIVVLNKSDCPMHPAVAAMSFAPPMVNVCAARGAGLDQLIEQIVRSLGLADLSPATPGLFCSRQAALVEAAAAEPAKMPALVSEILDASHV